MQDDRSMQQPDASGVDVTPDSALPDIPDAGPDSQPMLPPEPIDISTARLNIDATLVATTLDDGDERTLYEQAIDAYEASDGGSDNIPVPASMEPTTSSRRVRIYDSRS